MFCAELMSNMKDVPSTERMVMCSQRWKLLKQGEKDSYQKRCEQVSSPSARQRNFMCINEVLDYVRNVSYVCVLVCVCFFFFQRKKEYEIEMNRFLSVSFGFVGLALSFYCKIFFF